jgi:hypothetical protein
MVFPRVNGMHCHENMMNHRESMTNCHENMMNRLAFSHMPIENTQTT